MYVKRQMFAYDRGLLGEQLCGHECPPARSPGFYEVVLAFADHENWTERVLNHFFGDAAAEQMRQTAFGVSRHNNQVALSFGGGLDDFFLSRDPDADLHSRGNVLGHLIEPLGKLPGGILTRLFIQDVRLKDGKFGRGSCGRQLGDVQQNDPAFKMLCQGHRVGYRFLRTLRKIHWYKNDFRFQCSDPDGWKL